MKLYKCIIEDGENVFKDYAAANNEEQLKEIYGGNGEFIQIKDVTNEYFTVESPNMLDETLARCGWGKAERKILVALLEEHINNL